MSFAVTPTLVLATAVANAGTLLVAYPAGFVQANFIGANAAPNTGFAVLNVNEVFPEAVAGTRVNFTYNAGDVTVTNNTGATWPAGSTLRLQFGIFGNDRPDFGPAPAIAPLTVTVGTASDTVADVSAAFVQATLNNNFASLSTKINQIIATLRVEGFNL